MKMEDRFLETIRKHQLIEKGDTIIVGASGGPDSQFLIYMLDKLRKEIDFDIVLAHLNHLHRKEAAKDEDLVRNTAKNLGLKFFSEARSMDDLAKKEKISSEDAGRRLRYDFFNRLAGKFPHSKIAVAHNKDDQAETVLMRIVRGTGLDGLKAMAYRSGNIIRPILDIKKKDILTYLGQNNIPYAIDHTNFEADYTRNKIRLEVIPLLEEINPRFIDQAARLSDLAKDDLTIIDDTIGEIYDKICDRSVRAIKFRKNDFESLRKPYQNRLIRLGIEKLKGTIKDISKDNIDEFLSLITLANGKEIIKDDLRFRKSYDYYILEDAKDFKNESVYDLYAEDEIDFDGKIIKSSIINSKTYTRDRSKAYFDYDKLKFPLKVRTRRNGDKFIPLGSKSNKKLKDFFIDQKIDRAKRDRLPIILSDDKIIWITGLRMSGEFKVTDLTSKILQIEVYDED
ncbi:tRNA lysidine(34) synthetase TilS [Anaerococcus sp. NML200574]|uniref:tRNA lysidine(34) synthetase TilS n=1 Tax=Anaerococcus sp. NML200574 TaxID=2954486 RepID=UPI002237DA64|nr:tRNA lysidine(34) synthetase TilS [Anaerococcus sp. NML200574]MCW6678722.1 tRNA lysidine(34) synthetase TilS [Anaerococcus sp. NML200574]